MFDDITFLRDLARLPSAPFHEEHVAAYIAQQVRQFGLEPQQDRYGNLVVRYCGPRNRAGVQPLALVAHMDHPALEVIAVDGSGVRARVLGGVLRGYIEGAQVLVHGTAGVRRGVVTACHLEEDQAIIVADLEVDGPAAVGDYGVWDMTDFAEEGEYLRLRAADDLAGCAAVLSTLRALAARGLPGEVYGVFTRAEEVGLVGASLLAQDGTLPREAVVVSLESSRTLPGATVGDGPVIRVGDAQTTFHPEAEALLHEARRRLLQVDPEAKVQRQLMSGGTCEATAFGLLGYRTTGLALPLENYHNMGPEHRLLPEAIHRRDFGTAVDLLLHLVDAAASPFSNPVQERYAARAAAHRDRLIRSAQAWGW